MPIPYMGSKRKSAQLIFNTIRNHNPQSKQLVELFCGGFAIGEIFIKNGWNVIANDKNKYVVALLDKTLNYGLSEDIVTKWVSREIFKDIKKNPSYYEDWYVGYVQCIWSFGNTQTNYLFGKDVEPIKHA
jgi:adenine-specific DNA methylase